MKKFVTAALVAMLVASAAHADWIGDFAPGTTAICGQYTTYNPSTGAPATLAGTPVLAVYKIGDGTNSATESTTGLTHAEDVDSRTGLNRVCIDTSADGTFYSAGGQYSVVITTGTVNSVSVVGSEVKSFSLHKVAALRPATAGRTLVVDSAGLADANTVKVGPTGSGTAQTARDLGAGVLVASGGITEASFATTAGSFGPLGISRQATAQAATSTTVTLDASAPFGDNTNIGSTLWVKGSTNGNYWQPCSVTAYVASTKVATVTCASGFVTPTGTITYQQFGLAPTSGSSAPTANDVRDAVLNASLASFTSSGSLGERVGRIPNAAAGGNGGLPTADASNRVTALASVGTGSGQFSLSSGAVLLQATQTGVTIPTVTTVTNLTNAPTAGDLTATMKASVQTAATASLNAYDPPTGAEMDARTLPSANYATASNLATVSTTANGIKTTTDKVDTALELDGSVYRYTANALENAPAGGGGGGTDWTTGEKEQIRHRLGIDGTATAPSATPSLATAASLEQTARADAAIINCTVNTAFFAGSTTTVACILTDRNDAPITAASNDLEGRELLILSGAQIYEGRFITDSTWDAANSELRLTLSRALPGTLADAVSAIIR